MKGDVVDKVRIKNLINPVIHVVLTFIIGFSLINFDWFFSIGFIIISSCLMIGINAVSYIYSFKSGSWREYFLSLVIFVALVVFLVAIKIAIGDPSKEIDDENGEGLILFIVLILSIPTIVIGNLIGLFLKKYNKRQSS
ncbi:hypothetical protein [Paenibacillus agilis]|uniref:Uncharacterized protein n=1 Tax=Paenibacillus agilis TaxID=3020863 RepID=A0A559IX36_9BACL|nr:hypothetical protein [Paenibacillus agilis]TVX92194.1 hypothetical protein FPZ44_03455 [Paenibacillus agilis]